MNIKVSNIITVTDPSINMFSWCKRMLRIPNPEYAKKVRMGLWLGTTPKLLELFEIRGEELILPFGVLKSIPLDVTKQAKFESDFAPIKTVNFNADIPLYNYQQEAVDVMIKAKYGILQSPAGSGKTQMGIAIAVKLNRPTLWLCHTLDLVNQSKQRAEQYISKDMIGTIVAGKVNIGKGITFATIQTMSNLDLTQYKNQWDCIITDEVHRVSGTPTAITQYQKVLNSLAARHKYGLSATVHRSDNMIQATCALVGDIAYKVPDNAVSNKIMRVGIYPISTNVHMSKEALNTDGTLNYSKLITYLTENEDRNQLIVNTIEQKPSLILSDRLKHIEALMNLLPDDMRKQAVMISGKMTSKKAKEQREQAIEDMRNGKKKYLFATYSLAKEGLDIPCLERLYLTTPQKDYAIVTQSIGRIARLCERKCKPIAYDFVDDIRYFVNSYKKRRAIYRKNNCYFIEGDSM